MGELQSKKLGEKLIKASNWGKLNLVKELIEQDASLVNFENADGLFPLLMAAERGRPEVARFLLEKGAEIDKENKVDGTFPLLMAAQNDRFRVVDLLLEKGAEVEKENDKDGAFPLLLAAQNGRIKVAKMLFAKGAEINKENKVTGTSALLLAAQNGHAEVVKLLLAKGAEIDKEIKANGAFPLMIAAENGHAEVVKLLLAKGAEVDKESKVKGPFPLLQAAQNGHTEIVKLLLAKGAKVDKESKVNGSFPLLIAAENGHTDVVRLLLEKGAEVNKRNKKDGTFPIIQAAQNGYIEVVELLLAKGAKINNGNWMLQVTQQQDQAEMIKLLCRESSNEEREAAATQKESLDAAQLPALAEEVDPTHKNANVQDEPKLEPQNKLLISVESRKGGVGKTTIATNVAASLKDMGYCVLMIDCDLAGTDVTKTFTPDDVTLDYRFLESSLRKKGGLLELYNHFCTGGFKEDTFNWKKDSKQVYLIGSDYYATDTQQRPEVMYNDLQVNWFVEMLKEMVERFRVDMGGKPIAVIFDNSPGYVGLVPALREWLADCGPAIGKNISVASLDQQDVDASIASVSLIRKIYTERQEQAKSYDSDMNASDDEYNRKLKRSTFYQRLLEQSIYSEDGKYKEIGEELRFWMGPQSDQDKAILEDPSRYLALVWNKIPDDVSAGMMDCDRRAEDVLEIKMKNHSYLDMQYKRYSLSYNPAKVKEVVKHLGEEGDWMKSWENQSVKFPGQTLAEIQKHWQDLFLKLWQGLYEQHNMYLDALVPKECQPDYLAEAVKELLETSLTQKENPQNKLHTTMCLSSISAQKEYRGRVPCFLETLVRCAFSFCNTLWEQTDWVKEKGFQGEAFLEKLEEIFVALIPEDIHNAGQENDGTENGEQNAAFVEKMREWISAGPSQDERRELLRLWSSAIEKLEECSERASFDSVIVHLPRIILRITQVYQDLLFFRDIYKRFLNKGVEALNHIPECQNIIGEVIETRELTSEEGLKKIDAALEAKENYPMEAFRGPIASLLSGFGITEIEPNGGAE